MTYTQALLIYIGFLLTELLRQRISARWRAEHMKEIRSLGLEPEIERLVLEGKIKAAKARRAQLTQERLKEVTALGRGILASPQQPTAKA
ncbi:MAG: hypothetical protein AAFX99_16230 [Myxococcota bacterium]